MGCRDHSQARRRNNAAAPPPPSSARACDAASRGPLPRHPTLALTLNLTYPNLTQILPKPNSNPNLTLILTLTLTPPLTRPARLDLGEVSRDEIWISHRRGGAAPYA